MHENEKFIAVREGMLSAKGFIMFYYDEKTDQVKIARDIRNLNIIETIGLSHIIDNYATELMSMFGHVEEFEAGDENESN